MDNEMRTLNTIAHEIAQVARHLGLDFYPVNFEIVPAETLYTFGAYGMPVRFTHWSFGKAFYRMKIHYDLNLSRIYELVINTNPAYAFLLEGNRLIQNKLVIAHVYAHVDFFKNNYYFSRTPKDMIERMATHADQIRNYELQYGRELVEKTLDAVLAIQEHVDYRSHIGPRCEMHNLSMVMQEKSKLNSQVKRRKERVVFPYEDLWEDLLVDAGNPVSQPEYEDLLLYIMKFAPGLEEWQRDIVSIVREESLYFYPQIETKIINEGWATFWHARIMHELDLTDAEAVEFALMQSQVVQPSRLGLNPYYLGVKMWDKLAEVKSHEELFELREVENDLSFIRNHLTRELVEELNLFNFRRIGAHWEVTEIEWEKVRDNLVQQLVNGGHPRIVVVEGDYEGKGGLYLRHRHEGIDLDIPYLEKTLALVEFLWGKAVALETVVDTKKILYESSNGLISLKSVDED
ncbi:MAG: SpoVR family protein [Desulfosporosinus sp.]|jgi:stage V sporulation protein R